MSQARRIVGLSCGRLNGNSEIVLKEALMAAEELGIESEIIRAMEHKVKPCKGCEACTLTMTKGGVPRCSIRDDDVEWILDKVLVEDAALIVSFPVYHMRANAYFEIIAERTIPTMMRNPQINQITRVGAIICVGGGEPEWTPLGLSSATTLIMRGRKLVDQMQVNFCGRPGSVLAHDEYLARARRLGQNVAKAILTPIEEVEYVGDEGRLSCPVCHCNVLQVPDDLPEVVCPVCWVRGTIKLGDTGMVVEWNEDDTRNHRFSSEFILKHRALIATLARRFNAEQMPIVKARTPKYVEYGHIIKAERTSARTEQGRQSK
ncbi:MAG TPA: flavodoxin family protein [Thermoleophilia bacterium]